MTVSSGRKIEKLSVRVGRSGRNSEGQFRHQQERLQRQAQQERQERKEQQEQQDTLGWPGFGCNRLMAGFRWNSSSAFSRAFALGSSVF